MHPSAASPVDRASSPRFFRVATVRAACAVVACAALACSSTSGDSSGSSSGSPPTSGDGGVTDAFEQTRLALVAVLAADPRLAGTTALTPDDYEALAAKLAAVPGVDGADYVGDGLGTIYVKIAGGGFLTYRHLHNDLTEVGTLPPEADFANQLHATWNAGWSAPVDATQLLDFTVRDLQTNTYATHFPVATSNPDPEYKADDAVTCPQEGKIAIVDFLWTEAHRDFPGLYADQYNVDGVMLYDRLTRVAQAAGFTVDVFKDSEINLGNFTKLQDYAIVFTNGHGGRPSARPTARLGEALLTLATPELYEPAKTTAFNTTYEDAWKKGYFVYDVQTKAMGWTPWLFRDHYKPSGSQLVMLNECWSMLPFNIGLVKKDNTWGWEQGVTSPLYNFGDALMGAGVKAVFGYVSPATPEAVVRNTMPFFRRMFGGYSAKDLPPSPHTYWPTCMGAQTYFRLPNTPSVAIYGNKYRGGSMYTMYAVDQNQTFRNACASGIRHAMMQDFTLKVGTPATAFQGCWDTWWGAGKYPSGIEDRLCSQGDDPTTLDATSAAACDVKIARRVTNAMLSN
jgi:hypothetical protein